MSNFWLKVRVWSKVTLLALVIVYALLFVANNTGQTIRLWLFFGNIPETSPLVLALLSFVAGVVGTLLVRTTLLTIKQIRELRARNRAGRLEREVQDMKTKAAMLKSSAALGSAPPPSDPK